ncbi:uncharacterized protein K02A2.6-like [Teleopsis dalmanni]|nr:uncharacterized protein K02A2.6-like [Teleopsis dalmanni]
MLKTKEFCWTGEADAAFTQLKQILTSPQVLIPYDPSLPVMLATDASRTGLGAVLSHRLENGVDRPIAYASRTMTVTEQRYTQIDKEVLAIVWAVQKFFKYLYTRHWILITDHKPLSQILQPNKSLPVLCISRMANYAEFLSRFDFEVIYKNSKANANADYLSRASLQQINQLQQIVATHSDECDEFDNFMICQINQLPVKAERIAIETRKDKHLGKIIRLLESGRCLKREGYKSPEASYVLSSGCLTFEHRVVIPPHYRQRLLENLHTSHLGMVKMKGIARSFIYWPGIDKDIENMANECDGCARQANKSVKCDSHYWEYPKGRWERIHIDYAGPFEGAILLVIVDAYSKWLEVKITKSTTAADTISLLDDVFAVLGVPLMVVSDNGTNFTSVELNDFLTTVGVKYHKYSASYHPATNGQAERSVQTIKNALKAMGTTSKNLKKNLNEFLRQYKNTPHSTTGFSPAQLFLGRHLRTRLDLIRPEEIAKKVKDKQYLQCQSSNRCREFAAGQSVYFLSGNSRMHKWLRGTINTRLGDLHYEILCNGKEVKRHVNQIRRAASAPIRNTAKEYRESKYSFESSGDKTKDSLEAENNEIITEGSPGLENEFKRPENNEATTEGSPRLENEFERWTTPNTSRNEEFYSTPHPIAESTPETTNVTPAIRHKTKEN